MLHPDLCPRPQLWVLQQHHCCAQGWSAADPLPWAPQAPPRESQGTFHRRAPLRGCVSTQNESTSRGVQPCMASPVPARPRAVPTELPCPSFPGFARWCLPGKVSGSHRTDHSRATMWGPCPGFSACILACFLCPDPKGDFNKPK